MELRRAVGFAWNVFVVVLLGAVYVAALTVLTVVATLVRATRGKGRETTSDRDRTASCRVSER